MARTGAVAIIDNDIKTATGVCWRARFISTMYCTLIHFAGLREAVPAIALERAWTSEAVPGNQAEALPENREKPKV